MNDTLNRLVDILESGATAGVPALAYDIHDNQVIVNADNSTSTSFTYDDFGRRTSQTSPDTGVTTYLYDKADNLISKTDAKQVTVSYTYDDLNRLLTITYPTSSNNITYVYDLNTNGVGRLSTMSDSTGIS
jgi:YD repeat-containing protein